MAGSVNRILVLAPHADDEVLGVGGTIARHVAEGAEVHIAIVTNASIGAPELFSAETIARVREEARAAHALLGVARTWFEDLPAPRLDTEPCYRIAQVLGRLFREIAPRELYIPFRGDLHVDHRALFTAALVAARPTPGQPVRSILAYETLSETEWAAPFGDDTFIPTVFNDISSHLDQKLRALTCFESQMRPFPNSRSLEAVRALAMLRGATVNCAAAEAFHLIRDIR